MMLREPLINNGRALPGNRTDKAVLKRLQGEIEWLRAELEGLKAQFKVLNEQSVRNAKPKRKKKPKTYDPMDDRDEVVSEQPFASEPT